MAALAWLACLLCLTLAWSGLSPSCLPCLGLVQQQQPAAFGGQRRLRHRCCCCCWTRSRQGRQDRPRPDQAKARHNKQASQAKAAILDQKFDFLFSSQNRPKSAPRAPGGPGGPWGTLFPIFFQYFFPFVPPSPLGGPYFSFYTAVISPPIPPFSPSKIAKHPGCFLPFVAACFLISKTAPGF